MKKQLIAIAASLAASVVLATGVHADFAKSKDYTKAVSDYNMALQLNPQLAEAYYNRGLVYIFSGEQQAGLADLSKAGELGLFTSYSLIRHYMKK